MQKQYAYVMCLNAFVFSKSSFYLFIYFNLSNVEKMETANKYLCKNIQPCWIYIQEKQREREREGERERER